MEVNTSEDALKRFWAKVDRSGPKECWIWRASVDRKGYGMFAGRPFIAHSKNVMLFAHRYSWVIANGEIPQGLLVCHKCDTPPCVNPAHLFLGTNADNVRDMDRKGRRVNPDRRGSKHWAAKVDERQAEEIIRIYKNGGQSVASIARQFGIPYHVAYQIATRRSWKHVVEVA